MAPNLVNFLKKLFGLDAPKPPVRTGRDRDFDLKGLERIFHYQFKNPELARQAMTHRSYLHATPGRSGDSNERMEFLGDSVVGLIVNEYLYKKFTKLREGELTKMKSLLVSRVILSRAANQLGLGNYILLSEAEKGSGGRNRASILADTLEGAIGAVYLDGGIEAARQITERLLLREVNAILSDANLANYKSMLQEYVQGEFKTHPQYRISSEYGPDHQKMFTVEVVVSGKTFGRGQGSNKKEAEQEAARDALFHFEKLVRPEKQEDKAAVDARRRRRRGGRGRRNGRGGPELPGAVAGAEGGNLAIAGESGTHRRRRSRRDGSRDGARDGTPREPREREAREAGRDTPYEGAREGREGPRDRSRDESPSIHDAPERDPERSNERYPERRENRFGDADERSADRSHERSSERSGERSNERTGERSGDEPGHGPSYAATGVREPS